MPGQKWSIYPCVSILLLIQPDLSELSITYHHLHFVPANVSLSSVQNAKQRPDMT